MAAGRRGSSAAVPVGRVRRSMLSRRVRPAAGRCAPTAPMWCTAIGACRMTIEAESMSDGQTADTQALVVAPPQRPRRRRRWLTLDRKRVEIVEALAMGESLRETARQIGVSYWTLIDYVRHEDVSAEIEAERERVRIAARESRLR